ncbi:hypothetical protein [Pseudomonas helleri]|uniref:hypothetical protein n=1 Tax=Pseudomonas helleri TaxID=1608996 RepID=UPI002F35D7AB
MSDATSPKRTPSLAAQEAVLELIKASGHELFRASGVSEVGGKKSADFLIAFHKTLTEYYKTLE